MRKLTQLEHGEGCYRWGSRVRSAPSDSAGVVAAACVHREIDATREASWGGRVYGQPEAREGQAGPFEVAEGSV